MDRDDEQPHVPGTRLYIGTYTPPAPYRVFRVIQGGAKPSLPSREIVVDGDTTSTGPKSPHDAKT